MAIRRAIGARRVDVLVQLLLEAAVAGALSGVVAVVVYVGGMEFVRSSRVVASTLTVVEPVTAGLALLIGVAAALACAAVPALRLCTRQVAVQQIATSP
jgi:putative ABC transport system permease protein